MRLPLAVLGREPRAVLGRADPRDATHIQLWAEGDDGKVSREHLRLDVGPLACLVTDLGSSKGTRLNAKDGEKVKTHALLPGERLHAGAYTLTYVAADHAGGGAASSSGGGGSRGGLMSRFKPRGFSRMA